MWSTANPRSGRTTAVMAALLGICAIESAVRADDNSISVQCDPAAPAIDAATIAVRVGPTLYPISSDVAANVVSETEADCDSADQFVMLHVARPYPAHSFGSLSVSLADQGVWFLSDDQTTIDFEDFTAGAAGGPFVALQIPSTRRFRGVLSRQAVISFSPSVGERSTCWVSFKPEFVSTDTTPAPAPVATAGPASVVLSWTQADVAPGQYVQVLCADEDYQPLPDQGAYAFVDEPRGRHMLGYSTCTENGIARRANLPIAGPRMRPPERSAKNRTDGLRPTPGAVPFVHLDPRFVCSDILPGTTTSFRMEGLSAGHEYTFEVVHIDALGDPHVTPAVSATPLAPLPGGCALSGQGARSDHGRASLALTSLMLSMMLRARRTRRRQ